MTLGIRPKRDLPEFEIGNGDSKKFIAMLIAYTFIQKSRDCDLKDISEEVLSDILERLQKK